MADEQEQQTGGMVAYLPSAEHAQQLLVDGGEPLDQLHVTIAYLGDDVTSWTPEQGHQVMEAVRTATAGAAPIQGRAFAHTTFNPDGGPDGDRDPCAVYLIGDSPDLVPLRDAIHEQLTSLDLPDQHTPYVPHLTAGYGKTAADLTYTGPVLLDRIVVALGEEWHIIPLTGRPATSEDTEDTMSTTTKRAMLRVAAGQMREITAPRAVAASGGRECFRVAQQDLDMGACCASCGREFRAEDFYAERVLVDEPGLTVCEMACLLCAYGGAPPVVEAPPLEAPVSYGQNRDLPDPDGWVHGTIPVVVVEGMPTGDGRIIPAGSLTGHRALPLALMSLSSTGEGGHVGATLIGRMDQMERVPGPEVLNIDTGEPFPEGTFVWRCNDAWVNPDHEDYGWVRNGALSGISVDLAETEADFEFNEDDPDAEPMLVLRAGRIGAATLCTMPAFPGAHFVPDADTPEAAQPAGELPLAASGAWRMETEALCASCTAPPGEWFTDPGLDGPTALTITDDGRVYGHAADWTTCHIGLPGCVKAPRSPSGYAYFHTGAVLTADGGTVATGRVTLGTGHADLSMGAAAATEHYDHTGTAVADVAAGEDEHGIWLAGAIRPGVTAEQIRALQASPPSGDWRPIGGSLEMVGVLCVNVPGFPIPRARARVAAGVPVALVAAGAIPPKKETPVSDGPAETSDPVDIQPGDVVSINGTDLEGVVVQPDAGNVLLEVTLPIEQVTPVQAEPADDPEGPPMAASALQLLRTVRAEQVLGRIGR